MKVDFIKMINAERQERFEGGKQNKVMSNDFLDSLCERILEFFPGVSVSQVKMKSRKREFLVPRQITMYIASRHFDYTLEYTGDYFGGRDHSTVINSQRQVEDMYEMDRKFRYAFDKIFLHVLETDPSETKIKHEWVVSSGSL